MSSPNSTICNIAQALHLNLLWTWYDYHARTPFLDICLLSRAQRLRHTFTLAPIPSMPLSVDASSNLLKGLKILQSLGEAIPHGGGIIKAIAGIGITVLETVERVRVNREDCQDIAERVSRQILMLNSHIDLPSHGMISEDLQRRLEAYLEVLQDVVGSVERLVSQSTSRQIYRTGSIQDQTKDCLEKLDDAYRIFMASLHTIRSSLAVDSRLTNIENGMRSLSLRPAPQTPRGLDEPDEVPSIPIHQIEFGEEISQHEKKTHILRVEHGEIVDSMGHRRAVILRRFEATSGIEDEGQGFDEFKSEVDLRGDLLNRHFARMLGVASSSTGRTKMIVIEAGWSTGSTKKPKLTAAEGTITAYDYLQSLSGVEYLLEHSRVMCGFVAGYKFLREHGGSWTGRYREILLSAQDKRLCMGGLGRLDGRWEDSGWRMNQAFFRLRDGDDTIGGGNASFEESAHEFERMRESATKWSEEKTRENARDLFYWLWWWWSGSSEFELGTENSPSIGEIGWIDGKVWHPICLVHHFPLAQPPQYGVAASRWRDGEWETIVGTQIAEYTRWPIDVSPGETVYLRTFVRWDRTNDITTFFYGSALSLARDFGVDVHSLCLVSRAGFNVDTSLTISNEPPSTVYYFAYPPNSDGSVPEPPGFWSRCPDPLCSDCHIQVDVAQVGVHVMLFVEYERINVRILSLLQDFESHNFLPVPDSTYASDSPFATISEVSEPHASNSAIAKRPKKRFGDALIAAFSKKRKTL
ncbi:hypothetical protein SISNIDRAFT_491403 [Sistotremastrum niveocremeum HHB9708]|uniref:Mixed lineage kinase domain-containing protein n=1 Tax=Sistotremastrum niveocremeum HHB9708 TaxID=1314777 RepID=A0A164MUP0_9AGAM|nr:hypothetical protein SISNIDRAFT_491403 [Sistotremastrum niveocremeum HHB9708]